MRKLLLLAFALGAVAHCAAWADAGPSHKSRLLVTRHKANWYVSADGRDFHTIACTQTARLMDATVVRWHGRDWLVFLDSQGEEEGECEIRGLSGTTER